MVSSSFVDMLNATDRKEEHALEPYLVNFNYAVLGLVDELLWLPSAAAITTSVRLLYGCGTTVSEALVTHAGRGAPQSLAALLTADTPLGTLLSSRLGPAGVWRAGPFNLREARGISRDRYRQLQLVFVSTTAAGAGRRPGSLVRDVYAVPGRWPRTDSARRILDRVVRLNRAALALLAAGARGECDVRLGGDGVVPPRPYDRPRSTLDVLAEVLPPIAMPDFPRLAANLGSPEAALDGEESIDRYQSLFAEMLSLPGHVEGHS